MSESGKNRARLAASDQVFYHLTSNDEAGNAWYE